MANEWHAPYELLGPEAQDLARAIQSLIEELEATDWYNQRAQVTGDEALRRILEHHRDEEKEHAAMLLEWIRRKDPGFDEHLKTYLFKSEDILEIEERATAHEAAPVVAESSALPATETVSAEPAQAFTVGSLRPRRG
jgi:ferritin-like protein